MDALQTLDVHLDLHLEICHTGTVSFPPLKYKQYAVMRLFCEFRLDAPRADYISRYVGN